MELKIPSGQLFRDFSISFWAGLMASITIVFALSQESNLGNIKLAVWIFILFFAGLFITAQFDS